MSYIRVTRSADTNYSGKAFVSSSGLNGCYIPLIGSNQTSPEKVHDHFLASSYLQAKPLDCG